MCRHPQHPPHAYNLDHPLKNMSYGLFTDVNWGDVQRDQQHTHHKNQTVNTACGKTCIGAFAQVLIGETIDVTKDTHTS